MIHCGIYFFVINLVIMDLFCGICLDRNLSVMFRCGVIVV